MRGSADRVKLFSNGLQKEILLIILNELFYDFEKIKEEKNSKKQKNKSVKIRKIESLNASVNKRPKILRELMPRIKLDAIESDNIQEDIEKINKLNEDFRNKQKQCFGLGKESKTIVDKFANPACENTINNNDYGNRKKNSEDKKEKFDSNCIIEGKIHESVNVQTVPSRKRSVNTINEITILKNGIL